MDRYTEDLKYSLRRRLSESVDKGTLRTNDILARNHRQIVADFTDPRQWYYSATHDYIIGLLRESQAYNSGNVFGGRQSVSSRQDRHLVTPSSTVSTADERKRASLIVLPTETSQDLDEIRGLNLRHHEVASGNAHGDSPAKMRDKIENENTLSHEPEFADETRVENTCIPISSSHEFILERSLLVNGPERTDVKESVPTKVGNQSPIESSLPIGKENRADVKCRDHLVSGHNGKQQESTESDTQSAETVPNSNDGLHAYDSTNDHNNIGDISPAMQLYKASKQNRLLPKISNKKAKSSENYRPLDHLQGKMEKSNPTGKCELDNRTNRLGENSEVSLPFIVQSVQTTSQIPQSYVKPSHRARIGGLRTFKHSTELYRDLNQRHDKTGDAPYVEDWIRKVQIKKSTSSPLISGRSKGVRRHPSNTNKGDDERRNPYKSVSLPSDFHPLGSFPPLQARTSLYIYAMKQRSDLNIKFDHYHTSRPQRIDVPAEQQLTFKDDLKQTRNKIDDIEDLLGVLYQSESNLDKVCDTKAQKDFQESSRSRSAGSCNRSQERIPE